MSKQAHISVIIGLFIILGITVYVSRIQPRLQAQQNEAQVFSFDYKGEPVEVQTITVNEGEKVTLKFTSAVEEEAHIHGYDLLADITPGEVATIEFVASTTGKFEIGLHKSHTDLGILEVYPN